MDSDVCIVGAGVAGLNAAFVASQYLAPHQRIVIVDRHRQAGGMWNETYDYVRLHQPHPVFTAGDIPWTLGREPSYLPDREEVGAHLRHCLEVISGRVHVEPLWQSEYVGHAETGGKVEVTVRHLGSGETTVVRAGKLVKAVGFDIERIDPLTVSSEQVRSVSPNSFDIRGPELGESAAPAWIVGSGKTAMDTAAALITDNPQREVNLIAGSGTWYFNRDRLYPQGWRRWWAGTRPNAGIAEAARLFDGTNESEVRAAMLERYGHSPVADPLHNLFGILSEAEAATVRKGAHEIVRDHFEDVVDHDGVPHLLFRTGATREVRPGSWIVNCTGYFLPRAHPEEPYVSQSGAVLSINRSTVTLGFTSFSAYFLTHLMFLDKLVDAPLYAADMDQVKQKAGPALPFIISTLLQYNLSVIFEAVPSRVFQQCGLDFDRMYPPPRRLAGQLKFMARHRREREQHRRTLDVARERFGIRCGPIAPEQPVSAPA